MNGKVKKALDAYRKAVYAAVADFSGVIKEIMPEGTTVEWDYRGHPQQGVVTAHCPTMVNPDQLVVRNTKTNTPRKIMAMTCKVIARPKTKEPA